MVEWADTGMSHQSLRFEVLFCFLLEGLTQFRDSRVQSIQQRADRGVAGWPMEPAETVALNR